MKPSIADDIEFLVTLAHACASQFKEKKEKFEDVVEAANRVEAWLATYSPYKPLK